MSASPDDGQSFVSLQDIPVGDIDPNPRNPRLIFPQEEIERLAESIDLEGILVPVVVFPDGSGRYTLIDGERRYKCALMLGLESVPAVVTTPKTPRENLVQMFNIHLVREPWRDMPTAWALRQLVDELRNERPDDVEVGDAELSDLTGLSRERIRRLRHALELPDEWQKYIHEGVIPLNWFWELRQNVIEPLAKRRPELLAEYGRDEVAEAFVAKRLGSVITDTVSLRDVRPIINFAARDAEESDDGTSVLDATIRALIEDPELTISDAYEDTVQIMVEANKLAKRTENMLTSFRRLLGKVRNAEEQEYVIGVGRKLLADLEHILDEV